MPSLKPLILAAGLAFMPLPALAQTSPELRLPEELDETLRRMMDELKPALKQMFEMIESFEGVDDLRHYQMPEVLPNGDIIIRRRLDAPDYSPPAPEDPASPPTPPEDDGVTKT